MKFTTANPLPPAIYRKITMITKYLTMAMVAFFISTGCASAAYLEKSTTVAAKPADVWAKIGDFCQIQKWHPAITKCEKSTIDQRLHRKLTLADGATILEMQIDHRGGDDLTRNYSYIIHKGPLPVKNYAAFMGVEAAGTGTKITWRAMFDANGVNDAKAKEIIGGIFDAGLSTMKAMFK